MEAGKNKNEEKEIKKKKVGFTYGMRFKYSSNYVYQTIKIGGGDYSIKKYNTELMNFNTFFAGLVGYNIFDQKNTFSGYFMFGRILDGKITPNPIHQEEVYNTDNSYDIEGLRFEIGLGYSYTNDYNINVGINLYYTRTLITIEEDVYSGISETTEFSEIIGEIFIGYSI